MEVGVLFCYFDVFGGFWVLAFFSTAKIYFFRLISSSILD